jgi:predicted ArsR family transcriptional regulator
MGKRNSQNARLLRYLQSGRDITVNQARDKFGIMNMSARVNDLRNAGYAVYLNERVTGNGYVIKAYRLGTPRRSVVAAGHLSEKSFWVDPYVVGENLRLV